jgi:hypothetical protein
VAESILTSTKKKLNLADDYTAFDEDVITFINGAFGTLNQLGIGPEDGFTISDKTTTWDAFYGTRKPLSAVQTYVYLKVRMLFDPPQTSYLVEALDKQAKELEWRLNQVVEMTDWTDPDPDVDSDDDNILDGGTP